MSGGDSSSIDSLQSARFLGDGAMTGAELFVVRGARKSLHPSLLPAEPLSLGPIFKKTGAGGGAQHSPPLEFPVQRRTNRNGTPARLAWLWRSTNLTTVSAGWGLALVLHTVDGYYLSESLPLVIAGSAPHIFPPLGALLICAVLAVAAQRGKAAGARYYETLAERCMLMTMSFAVGWTAVEWVLRLCGLTNVTRRALPLEVLFTAVVVVFYVMACGGLERWFKSGDGRRDVLIVGTDAAARDVRDYLGSLPDASYRFRGFISTGGYEEHFGPMRGEIAGHVDDLVAAARAMFVDEVIVSTKTSLNHMEDLCVQAREHQITLRFVPSVSESLRRSAEVQYIGSLPTIVAFQRKHRPISLISKRTLDLVLGSLALIVLSPVLLVIAIAVKLQSEGPVLYASERVGVRGRGFLCYKFRTMVPNAEALRSSVAHLNERKGILFKIAKDPRVTRLGAWLRKYSLDELPQLFNVLRGEMSLVGPRPSLRAEVVQYQTPHFRRLDVIPGMTGLWQVEARTDPSFESYVALDCRYANDWSIWLDLRILVRTFRIVFLGTGV